MSHSVAQGQSSNWRRAVGSSNTQGIAVGVSMQHTEGSSEGQSRTTGESTSRSSSESTMLPFGHSPGHGSNSESAGLTITNSGSRSESRGSSVSDSAGESQSASQARGTSYQFSLGGGESRTTTNGSNQSRVASNGITTSRSQTVTGTIGESTSTTNGQTQSHNHSVTLQLSPLQKVRVEKQQTGRLVQSVDDQFAQFAKLISSLAPQHCLVAVAAFNRTFVLRVDDVLDPFEAKFASPAWRKRAIAKLKDHVFSTHEYYLPLAGHDDTALALRSTFPHRAPHAEHAALPDPFFPRASSNGAPTGKS